MKAQKQKKSLAETLVEIGLLSNEQVKEAQNQERESGQPFRRIIVQKGYVSEEDLISFMAAHMGLPRIELRNYIIDAKVIGLITEELARKHHIIPILKIGNSLTCAMFDPLNIFAIDELRNRTGFDIEPAVATEQEIKEALNQYYSVKGSIDEIVKTIDKERVGLKKGEEFDLKKLQEVSGEPPVVRLVNLTIMQAVKEGASDIHIEPEEDTVRIRYRIDGILYDRSPIPKYLQSAIISRIKILSELNIAEHRASQDGRFQIKIESRQIDIRVSVVATIFGENVVLRLLDRSSSILSLSQLGFSKEILGKYEKLILRPFGIILVTGPTGSGKTTTLYASLNLINSSQKNIITIEDPVEYHLDGIRQIQVEPKAGTTFATGLRSILRQDPDVIMVGEIRDRETAEIAIQASLTGHLVFSTLHTNDASSAVSRLIDMGVEPFLVSSALIGVLAQRLVRAICKECKEEYIPSEELMNDIGYKDNGQGAGIKFFKGKGCPKCSQSGYRGRIGIFELMPVDDALRSHITAKAPREEIKKQAEAMGIVSLKADGLRKAKDGITTVEEVLRLTQEE
ncbi:MAG: type II secretion system protein GspE [Omnitrophica WOR_2 bacterium GWF2_43_52]|nr:MAG: type II secretion system protein GspE [Omnitrophica WOR_2 bacterium GWF2_43_52]HAH20626.1 type II secretion system protein GspE [Candidatus Omnitrophota bacterium]HBG63544.1 type II secretion system protein GspE [Candidatus Omnitrophota bacterium]